MISSPVNLFIAIKLNAPRQISHSKIYREFRTIESTEYRTVRRFYEEYETEIKHLEFEESFELLLAYSNALFELGLYEKFLPMADAVIETSISHTVKFFNGIDVFQETLLRKAASHYHMYELEKCEYILREILRIDPYDDLAADLLKKCRRKMRSPLVRHARALSMSLFLLSAVIICLEMLAVRPFYEDNINSVEYLRTGIFILGLLFLAGGEYFHHYRCGKEVDGFVEVIRKRK